MMSAALEEMVTKCVVYVLQDLVVMSADLDECIVCVLQG